MPKKPYERILITERDVNLFKYLYENKVAKGSQIKKDLFSNVTKQVMNLRLQKLYLHGYIEHQGMIVNCRAIPLYKVTDKGVDVFKSDYKYNITSPTRTSDAVNHDTDWVDIRRCLKKISYTKEIITENMLQTCREFKWQSADSKLSNTI